MLKGRNCSTFWFESINPVLDHIIQRIVEKLLNSNLRSRINRLNLVKRSKLGQN